MKDDIYNGMLMPAGQCFLLSSRIFFKSSNEGSIVMGNIWCVLEHLKQHLIFADVSFQGNATG